MRTMIEKMAMAIAKEAVKQNPMLEYFDDNGIGYFDDYDNKNYDCIAIARAELPGKNECFSIGRVIARSSRQR